MKPLACSFQSWRRTAAGFAGAERALLICVALAIVLAVGVLVRGGSDQAAGDASRTLAAAGSGLGDIGRGGLMTGLGHFPAAGPLGGAAGVSGTVQANSGASGGGGGILGTIGGFFSGVGHVAKTALHVGLDVVASAAYAPYYFSHAALQGLNHLGDHL